MLALKTNIIFNNEDIFLLFPVQMQGWYVFSDRGETVSMGLQTYMVSHIGSVIYANKHLARRNEITPAPKLKLRSLKFRWRGETRYARAEIDVSISCRTHLCLL